MHGYQQNGQILRFRAIVKNMVLPHADCNIVSISDMLNMADLQQAHMLDGGETDRTNSAIPRWARTRLA